MANVVKFEVAELPKIYLIGKATEFSSEEYYKGHNHIPEFWDRCLADGTFFELERQSEYLYEPAYVGACMDWDTGYGTFSYICGMLFRDGVTVPEGYAIREIGEQKIGKCWIKGKNSDDVCLAAHELTMQAIKDAGLCPNQMNWSMQLSVDGRFNAPDDNGEIILDYCISLAQSFKSLGHRVIYPYLATYPPFKQVANAATEDAQRQMYDFLYDSISIIYTDLSIINVSNEPDDCYEYWQMSNAKPGLIASMQNARKNFLAFYEYLIKLGLAGEVMDDGLFVRKDDLRITQKIKDKLSKIGLICNENKEGYFFAHKEYKEMFPAYKLHCNLQNGDKITAEDVMDFLNGRFNGEQFAAAEMFGNAGNSAIIHELEQYFIDKGYTRKNLELKVVYEKEYQNKTKADMNIFYDWRKVNPLTITFKAPQFSKAIKFYDQMDAELKSFVFNRTKTCDGCGYCTQTDKTGKRKRLALSLDYKEVTRLKCPLFPSVVWDNIKYEMICKVKKLFDFAESVLN